LGPNAYFITFNVDYRRSRGLLLAEPVAPPQGGDVPVRILDHPEPGAPHFRERDHCLGSPPDRYSQTYRYVQVVPRWERPPPAGPLTPEYTNRLLYQPVPGIARWTGELLQRLVAQHRLTEEEAAFVLDPAQGEDRYLLPQHRYKVSRALSDYFALSGDFTYQLEMRRADKKLDPIEDFLRNTRAGFCEHYATALALVLRSVGIPARVVVGYHGAEPQGDSPGMEGVYLVRQSDAHSWVEALLPRRGSDGQLEAYWQTLDPTPAVDPHAKTVFSWGKWWRGSQQKLRDFWKNLILDYNVDRRQDMLATLAKYLGFQVGGEALETVGNWIQEEVLTGRLLGRRWPWIAVPPVLGLGWWAVRRRRTPKAPGLVSLPAGDVAFYRQWLTLVSRYCRLERRPTQTPWEFGDAVRQALSRLPGSAVVAEVSRQVVDLYYRVRFGNRPLTPDEKTAMERQVAELEPHFVASHGGAGRPSSSR